MRRAILQRLESTDEGTFGRLTAPGLSVATVELPWRQNRIRLSCIPDGLYRCAVHTSPRFGRCYWLQEVPGRSEILIHPANFGGDVEKGYRSDVLGCIGPAMEIGRLRNGTGELQRAGIDSRRAMEQVLGWGAGQPFELEIRECPSVA